MSAAGINVFPAKVWADPTEILDYADLDAAGQPLFAFFSNAIGSQQVDSASMVAKINGLGGPAIRSSFTLTDDFTVQAGFQLQLVQITVTGVTANAITFCSGVLGSALLFFTVAAAHGVVNLYVFNTTAGNITISKGVRIELAFFNLL